MVKVENGKAERLVRGVVARGRTVHVPTDQKVLAGYERETNRPIERIVCERRGPGETVELPGSEVKRLRALGFLVDPDLIAESFEGPALQMS
jgi:hypothetical protein